MAIKKILYSVVMAISLVAVVSAQEQVGYVNYAADDFVQETVEQQTNAYYDLFGQHITNGYFIYDTKSVLEGYSTSNRPDSLFNLNNEYRASEFFSNFNNLCITKDQISGAKTALIIGDQIHSQFTPLTMNKMYFSGIRWDMQKNGFGLTTLMSRTRPGRMAMRGISGQSYVTYPSTYSYIDWDKQNYLNTNTSDWSVQTMYGDYDFFYGIHGEKKISDKLNIGATFMNHHRNDAKNGESWIGQLPEGFAPKEIHFEIYDLTPKNINDPGAKLHSLSMTINGNTVVAAPEGMYNVDATNFMRTFAGAIDDPIMGQHPRFCTFYPRDHGIDADAIKSVTFEFKISGNYLIFVSTEKMTPLYNRWGKVGYTKEGNAIFGPVQQTIEDIVDVKINQAKLGGDPTLVPGEKYGASEVYFGDYILRSPKIVTDYNAVRTFEYEYRMILASIVNSINLNGHIFDTDYNAEISYNAQRYAYPLHDGDVSIDNSFAAYLQLSRPELMSHGFMKKINTTLDVYAIDAMYNPSLPQYQVSRSLAFMSNTLLKTGSWSASGDYPHYNDYPIQLYNNWNTIDDNDDDDLFVETQRQPYPSDMPSNQSRQFFADGALRSNNEQSWGGISSHIRLPSGYDIVYNDNDGVISERYDRNRNGEIDYKEDFLLFESDPPKLSLDIDRNNNNVFDVEEDDLYPDFPYEMGYVYTTNGVRSSGIRGMRGVLTVSPYKHVAMEIGGVFEQIQDADLDGKTDNLQDLGYGQNISLYSFTSYNKRDRAKGITSFAGAEIKRVFDGIRNDVVLGKRDEQNKMVYQVKPDMLRMKDALVTNFALGFEHRGFKNTLLVSRMFYGMEKHYESDPVYVTRALSDTLFEEALTPYTDKMINSFIFLAKGSYTFKTDFEFQGPAAILNLCNKLTIVPQYKFMYEMDDSQEDDPRFTDAEIDSFIATNAYDSLKTTQLKWLGYKDDNQKLMYNVPIVRFTYALGRKTYFEGGWQWKRIDDFAVSEMSRLRKSTVLQLRNRTTYSGFDISIILGLNLVDEKYDVNQRNEIYDIGSEHNTRSKNVFFQIFAGTN